MLQIKINIYIKNNACDLTSFKHIPEACFRVVELPFSVATVVKTVKKYTKATPTQEPSH